jgi:dephospho-CoA kinase
MRVVGLTGGIASGKSTVATRWRDVHDLAVVDCDDLAKAAVEPGAWGHRRVVAALGPGVLSPDGRLDREKVGELVFADEGARRKLNAATHAPVALALAWRLLRAWLACRLVVAVDMPLLYETGAWRATRPVILVTADAATRGDRVRARDGLSATAAAARIAAQMPDAAKLKLMRAGDIVLANDGDLPALAARADAAAARARAGARWHALLTPPALAGAVAAIVAACTARR